MNKLRQGQTVYYIDPGFFCGRIPIIKKWFLYSSKVKLPLEGCVIENMTVDLANKLVAKGDKLYTSKAVALTALNLLIDQR